jgi:hypothetical protein
MTAGAAVAVASFTPVSAFPLQSDLIPAPEITLVDQGCGPGWWRGPWGHCRDTPYSGNLPGGGYGTNIGENYSYGYSGNGCAPGWWRGPWGHCRDTPYHGRLPDGSWQ